jgi:asparagine synthase (glutamine-hydrolysing)
MSGICGILSTQPAVGIYSPALQRGLDAMAHRGHDGTSCYDHDRIFIGHRLFETGCNGFAVDQDGFVISFDGRLDNRNALSAALRAAGAMSSPSEEGLTDTRLLLLAYRHFGRALPNQILGDFAIAIWDPELDRLFLCRDHFGVRPLFFRAAPHAFFFGSEIKVVASMSPECPMIPRTEAMEAFVDGEFDELSPERTFYDDINRLLPGHYALVQHGTVAVKCYWRLNPALPGPINDIPAKFRRLFKQAINRRLRSSAPVAALLSGGLDSSSIVSMIASSRETPTVADVEVFSLVFNSSQITDERHYIAAVAEEYPGSYHHIDGSPASALGDADDIIMEQDQPPLGPNGSIFRYFLRQISTQSKAKILLHGHGGDEVISDGAGIFGELAASAQWVRLWTELNAVKSVTGSPGPHFRRLVWHRGIKKAAAKVIKWPTRLFGKNERVNVRDHVRFAPNGKLRPHEQIAHLRKLTTSFYGQALEMTDHDAAFANVEIRMPFLDVELAEFCVTIEAKEKWSAGYPRSVIRNAMVGILPERIRLRTDKHDFADNLRATILRDDRVMVDEAIFRRGSLIAPYVKLAKLRADWSDLKSSGDLDNIALMQLWRAVMLSRWIARNVSEADMMVAAE